MSLIYSIFGASLALITMIALKKLSVFSEVGVSVAGGVMHNAGQVLACILVMENVGLSSFLPPLVIFGVIAGVAVGIASALLIKKTKRFL